MVPLPKDVIEERRFEFQLHYHVIEVLVHSQVSLQNGLNFLDCVRVV